MSMNENGKKADGADLIVYGKIFTSENDQITEAFAETAEETTAAAENTTGET